MNTLQDNLRTVQARISAACADCGRDPSEVTLLAVSKTFHADAVQEVADCGQRDFGENYIQEGVDKITFLQSGAKPEVNPEANPKTSLIWHCIGPIQSNKTKYVAEFFSWAHTVDRLKIAQRLNDQRPVQLPPLNICLQVNIDGGATKSGIAPEEVLALAMQVTQLPRLVLRGLMTIPDPVEGFKAQIALHSQARMLFDKVRAELKLPNFDTLSMGMTADLEAAIHAGSTMVRVGTAIFGKRDYSA